MRVRVCVYVCVYVCVCVCVCGYIVRIERKQLKGGFTI